MSVGWRSSTYLALTGSNGGNWITKDQTKITLTAPENVAGVELLSRYTHGLGLLPRGNNQKSAGEMLIKGTTVFEPQGPYRVPDLRNAGVTRFGAVPWPRGPHKPPPSYNSGTPYTTMLFKSADAARQRAAAIVAVGLLSDEAQATHAMTDLGLPVTKSGKDSATYQRFLAGEPVVKAFVDMFPSCDVWPAIPSLDECRQIMDATMLQIYDQTLGIKDALAGAERQLQQVHDAYLAQSKK